MIQQTVWLRQFAMRILQNSQKSCDGVRPFFLFMGDEGQVSTMNSVRKVKRWQYTYFMEKKLIFLKQD